MVQERLKLYLWGSVNRKEHIGRCKKIIHKVKRKKLNKIERF